MGMHTAGACCTPAPGLLPWPLGPPAFSGGDRPRSQTAAVDQLASLAARTSCAIEAGTNNDNIVPADAHKANDFEGQDPPRSRDFLSPCCGHQQCIGHGHGTHAHGTTREHDVKESASFTGKKGRDVPGTKEKESASATGWLADPQGTRWPRDAQESVLPRGTYQRGRDKHDQQTKGGQRGG